ncbi:hypothetical protein LUZ62_075866 [Rhynchospora pubera]|uniref:Phosphatidic acid phosphatase type 2/haloperoxidase domain-containing protein n=1 Tax=Rhynchospora pubera TaxID=906938 RepID=A0AAV8DGF5_9POAL|nr:hypothetical protein LUZ62_075866 [Rhynchospora pubera]
MREFQSRGTALARKHLCDWLTLILLIAILTLLSTGPPFYRFVGKDMMTDLKYPHKPNTVPPWAIPVISIVCPVVIILGIFVHRRDVYDLHQAILGLLFSVVITGVITDAIKNAVGRPRPDFFWRCFPDGKEVYDQSTGEVICHGIAKVMNDGHKSFPSGHTSYAFAGLGFVSLYLSGKIKAFDRRGHVSKLCIVFLPLLVASLVGISRVSDYRHHWQDVFVGGLLGFLVGIFCYLHFFPPPNHSQGWGPYAYFEMLEKSGGEADRTNAETPCNVREDNRRLDELEFGGM